MAKASLLCPYLSNTPSPRPRNKPLPSPLPLAKGELPNTADPSYSTLLFQLNILFYFFLFFFIIIIFFPEALQLIGKELKFPSPFLPGPAASRNVMHLDEQTEITGKGQIYCKSISWPRPQCRHLEGKSDTKVPFWIQS